MTCGADAEPALAPTWQRAIICNNLQSWRDRGPEFFPCRDLGTKKGVCEISGLAGLSVGKAEPLVSAEPIGDASLDRLRSKTT
jgi:hypothetical protein